MLGNGKKITHYLDGENKREPSEESTCPFSEGCKLHFSPGDIVRYSLAIIFAVFGGLFVLSLFFPELISPPNMNILHNLVTIFHYALGGNAPAPPLQTP